MNAQELANAHTEMEKEFAVDWVHNVYARCKCGMMLYYDPDCTQDDKCRDCKTDFYDAQSHWDHVLLSLKARVVNELGSGTSIHSRGSTSSVTPRSPIVLHIPGKINGIAVNMSCKDVFEKCVFVAYNKDPKLFDDNVAQIGNIGPNLYGCYAKYLAIYESYTERRDKMAMNLKIRSCQEDPANVVAALIDIFTKGPNVSV